MGSAQCGKTLDKRDTDYFNQDQRTRVDSYDEVENHPCFGCRKVLRQNVDFCSDCTFDEKFQKKICLVCRRNVKIQNHDFCRERSCLLLLNHKFKAPLMDSI